MERGFGSKLGGWVKVLGLLTLIAVQAFAQDSTPAESTARVEFFSPQGYVRGVRQVTARFSVSMVALGDPRLPDPFSIDCPATGKGRWADDRDWVYDFEADLPAQVSCRFSLRKGISGLQGERVLPHAPFTFNTGGPAVVATLPREGSDIDEAQVFILRLDARATSQSIAAHASCLVEGVGEQIPVEILSGAERDAVLKARAAVGYDSFSLLWKNGRETQARVRNRDMERLEAQLLVLRCARRLPPDTQVRLNWGKGIEGTARIATDSDQQLAFHVRESFSARLECTRQNARAGCMPLYPVKVIFSAPVPRAQALAIKLTGKDGRQYAAQFAGASNAPTVETVEFPAPFPESVNLTVSLPNSLKDDAGRELINAERFPLTLRMDALPALAKFAADFGILEASEGGVLPVTVRNLESNLKVQSSDILGLTLKLDDDPPRIAAWLRKVEKANQSSGLWQDKVWRETTGTVSVFAGTAGAAALAIKRPAAPRDTEVIGIPLKHPGFYVVELESRLLGASLLGRDEPRYVSTAALVTNLAVHFKWGRESSRVWVTRLSDGAAVADAEVAISDYCSGAKLFTGRTDRDGIATVGESIGTPGAYAGCAPFQRSPLMVTARKADDFSFTLSSWNEGIAPYQFGVPVGNEFEADIWHTVLDRPLFRAGETVSMKHYLRRHVMAGIAAPGAGPTHHDIVIQHEGSDTSFKLASDFDAAGIGENRWQIPADARLGMYNVEIDGHRSGEFRVEEFRLPSMHASISGSSLPIVNPVSLHLDVHVAYLSGGGASALPVKVRTLIEAQPQSFADYADYQFGGEPLIEGLTTGGSRTDDYDFEDQEDAPATKTQVLPATLDESGAARILVPHLPKISVPSVLTAELEYADANGEVLTASTHVSLVPSALAVGIRTDGWVSSPEKVKFKVVVLNLAGKPQARTPVTALLYQSSAYTYRKRLIGGFYAYESTREIKKLATACQGMTDEHGLLYCDLAPGISGQVLLRAEATDDQGRMAGATAAVWVAGADEWWFGGTHADRMDILPEKKEYQAGEVARFQVRMPFRAARALVTVEREGVIKSFVTPLKGNAPVIEVPIEAAYAPNVFVSVLAERGRIAHAEATRRLKSDEEITALVDLNKPAYRLGVAEIKVGWRGHRLRVNVTPAHASYRVRDPVDVRVKVKPEDGSALPAGAEITLAAVDEALLDLQPNHSWDLLSAMMGERGLEVFTSTAQMQVVGKRHYGRKAVTHGGGGGRERDRTRELFQSLLYWKGRITLDENGEASAVIPLNDSLTSFRIVAVASAGADRFGSGAATIRTTQDVMLTSGLPATLREGDQYLATFTVRNTTEHAMQVRIGAKVSPPTALAPQSIAIAAGQSRDVTWNLTVPFDTDKLLWDVSAEDEAGGGRDHLKVTERVEAAYPVRTYQATIAQLTSPLSWPTAIPAAAIPGRGGLEVTLQGRLAGSLKGVEEYMRLYSYVCLEQQLSKAVALHDAGAWDFVMARLPVYMDADGLLKYFPSDWLAGDDTLTSYVLSIAQEAHRTIPDAERARLLQALTQFVDGKIVRYSSLNTADLSIRKLAAIAALSRYQAAKASMLDSIPIEPNLWPTSAVLDWIDIVTRVPEIPDGEQRLRSAFAILRSRLNFQGTVMGFSTERRDALWWLMISEDSNANRLLIAALNRPDWRADIPRLVRGTLSREVRGHWNTTVANAWGMLAMDEFSAAFESAPVTGSTRIDYAESHPTVDWPLKGDVTGTLLPWAQGSHELTIVHTGSGAPWAMVRANAALPLERPLSSGYKIARSVRAVEQRTPGRWSRGDVARIHLDIEAQSDMAWVVIEDPIPSGASILGSGLGHDSALLSRDEASRGFAWPIFSERTFQSYRAYYQFVPKGRFSLEYTVRFNNPGTFMLPASRVEAMYAPEMFGEAPNPRLTVTEAGDAR